MRMRLAVIGISAAAVLTACSSSAATSNISTPSPSPSSASPEPGGVALVGGDIPDNQVYLDYPSAGATSAGFTIKYPEGWVLTSRSDGATFTDKDNQITVTIRTGSAPTPDSVHQELSAIAGANLTAAPQVVSLAAGSGVAATYQVDGKPNPVTGKRPRLTIDRYELASGGKVAALELATPVGVDNVDAYKMIAGSFRWR